MVGWIHRSPGDPGLVWAGRRSVAARVCWKGAVAVVLAWLGTWGPTPTLAQQPVAWLSGPELDRELRTVIPRPFLPDTPLRRAVENLARDHRVAILLDRRVDPDLKLGLTLDGLPLEEVFQHVAEADGHQTTRLGALIYLGPPQASALLRTVCALRREEVGRLPAAAAKRWLAAERMRWNNFATPRQLLGELAAAGGLDLSGLQQVPHDLWAGTDLPPLPLVDRVSLILIQFDLTFQLGDDGNRAALIPIPERVAIVRVYPGGPQPEILARKWAALVPESEVRVSGEKIWVRGPLEDQEKIAAARRGVAAKSSRKPLVRQGETRFTVNGKKGPLDRMLGELADKLDLELRIDKKRLQQAGISLTQEVSFQVKDATLDELLDAVVAPAGCTFRRQGKIVEVIPAR